MIAPSAPNPGGSKPVEIKPVETKPAEIKLADLKPLAAGSGTKGGAPGGDPVSAGMAASALPVQEAAAATATLPRDIAPRPVKLAP